MDEIHFHGMVTRSPRMEAVFLAVRRFGPASEPVLLLGESGTGKEGLARAIHAESRRSGPFVALNCGALATGVVDGELFGYAKGAFTGAEQDKRGAFEVAHGGTLFLDELGELPLDLQAKLLRVLESRAVRRLGEMKERPVDTRVVAATHRSLEVMVEDGRFRKDLFHRLCVLDIEIPPLRARPEDIRALTPRFLPEGTTVTEEALHWLEGRPWPGNVRELKNVLTRATWMGGPGLLQLEHLRGSRALDGATKAGVEGPPRRPVDGTWTLWESERILEALQASGGNRAAAARRLGLAKSTFHDRLRRLGVA